VTSILAKLIESRKQCQPIKACIKIADLNFSLGVNVIQFTLPLLYNAHGVGIWFTGTFLSYSTKIVPRTVLWGFDFILFGIQKENIFTTSKKRRFAFFAHTVTVETGWPKMLKWSYKTFLPHKILF
jgi:hypothetical protein